MRPLFLIRGTSLHCTRDWRAVEPMLTFVVALVCCHAALMSLAGPTAVFQDGQRTILQRGLSGRSAGEFEGSRKDLVVQRCLHMCFAVYTT